MVNKFPSKKKYYFKSRREEIKSDLVLIARQIRPCIIKILELLVNFMFHLLNVMFFSEFKIQKNRNHFIFFISFKIQVK